MVSNRIVTRQYAAPDAKMRCREVCDNANIVMNSMLKFRNF